MKELSISQITKSYRLLGLPVGAPYEDVVSAFKKHRNRVHPDKHALECQITQDSMTSQFIQVKQAFDFLSNN